MDTATPSPAKRTEPEEKRLLLSSLAVFWSLIEPLVTAAAPKKICEIGIGEGEFTQILLEFCKRNDCSYTGIDSALSPELVKKFKSARSDFFIEPSLSVLKNLPPQDVYFVDGDHNYFTVLNELRLILREPERWPLVILHDVGWPWGRRDQYCAPDSIPQGFRHPNSSSLGVLPGNDKLGPDGFSGEASAYKYAAAEHEGGPRNGVLSAVEDFLRESSRAEWKLLSIPSVFGLGILSAPEKCASNVASEFAQLQKSLAPLQNFLSLLERNRIDLFLTHLRQISEYNKLALAYKDLEKHSESLHERYRELLAHSDSLLAAYKDLEAHTRAVQKSRDELLNSIN